MTTPSSPQGPIREVAAVFLKLGVIAFGGPAAHIALMRDEVVRRRKWVSEQQFLDLLGGSSMIPGPTSTQLAIYLGYVRSGWRGLILAGSLFILPAMLSVLAIAWAYVRYGSTPQAAWFLYGIKPVIIAVVIQAIWGLARTAAKGPLLAAVGVVVFALSLRGGDEIALLFGGGLAVMLIDNAHRLRRGRLPARALVPLFVSPFMPLATSAASFSFGALFLTFLKIGGTLYGSGYVLLAYLRHDFVDRLGWLTDRQLIDAVAVGQFTPGPVFTTATFVGYLLGGLPGAVLATVAIFLPSFVLVWAVYPLIPRLRGSSWMSGLLDGVNAAALGLMAAVSWHLGRAAIIDWPTATLAFVAAVLLIRYRVNSAWLILAGGLGGIAIRVLAGAGL